MAWARVQEKSWSTATAVTLDDAIAAGNKVVVASFWTGDAETTSVVDTLGNTYTPIVGTLGTNANINRRTQLFYCDVTNAGTPEITAVHTAVTSDRGIAVSAYTGLAAGGPEASSASTGNSANGSTSLTTLSDDALVFSHGYAFASISTPAGWTMRAPFTADLNKATAGLTTATWQHSSAQWIVTAAAFAGAA